MANKLKGNARHPIYDTTTTGLATAGGILSGTLLLNPNYVDFKNIPCCDNKVRDRANATTSRVLGVKVFGGQERDLGLEVASGVRDEAGSAILDARRPVHHLIRREAHFSSEGSANQREGVEN